ITVIRRNWHLLPYAQLLELLGWIPEEMAFILKEDDFLYHKLGNHKPQAERVSYAPLTGPEELQTAWLRKIIETHFGKTDKISDPPFGFLHKYGTGHGACSGASDFDLKLVYSYSATYGDPLLNAENDPYPEKLLSDYAANGINAVWLPGVLYTLVPWPGDTGYSVNWEKRLENLRKLTARAAGYGIRVYLYMNEPRNMPAGFFSQHPGWKGAEIYTGGAFALCTSNPEVLPALRDGMARLFREVPVLGGVFTITMSENLTHCRSKPRLGKTCPACDRRNPVEFPVEVNRAIAEGVHSAAPEADVIAWTWGWDPAWDEQAIALLPKDIKIMCVSETDVPTDAMGIKGRVSDYSISKPGPGPIAKRLHAKAAQCGLRFVAKVQLNNTWECSAVPYIPVPYLVEEHLNKLKTLGISNLMVGWTLGGYPGGNLELLQMSKEKLAEKKFGKAAAWVLEAWHKFSTAFREFPLHKSDQLYHAPQNFGPMDLLFAEPTGYKVTMVGFPYDDLWSWSGGNHYPEDVFEEQFRKLSEGWSEGLELLNRAEAEISENDKANFADLFNVAEAAYCHFRSTYLQIRFIRQRNAGNNKEPAAVLEEEIAVAKRLLEVVKRDSRIGFEASNHYYYTVNDLKEKVLNCEYLKAGGAV
ncbi:MAG: hypothetical protein PHV59_10255, partial [Victivallales bacterium]|nr:hypothetical protein [Victivallales bacterium]